MDTRIDSFFVKKKNSVSNSVKSSGSTKSEIEKSSKYLFVSVGNAVGKKDQRYQKMEWSWFSIGYYHYLDQYRIQLTVLLRNR